MSQSQSNTLPDIRHTVIFEAPMQKVWDAVSTSESIAAWFMPNTFEPKLGHVFTLKTPYGTSTCEVKELDPPRRLAFSWGDDWLISFELKDLDGKTELTLTHSGWGEANRVLENGLKKSEARDRMDHGWGAIVGERLREIVEA